MTLARFQDAYTLTKTTALISESEERRSSTISGTVHEGGPISGGTSNTPTPLLPPRLLKIIDLVIGNTSHLYCLNLYKT